MTLPWLAGVRAFEGQIPAGEGWFDAWQRALSGWNIELCEGGALSRPGGGFEARLGSWALVDDGPERDRELAWCDAGCPLVGPRVGALTFEVYDWVDPGLRHELFCGLLKEGRDGLVHRPSGRSWPAVALRQRPLGACVDKASFDDGAELLTRHDGAYAAWVLDAFEASLRAAGYQGAPFWLATSHNCLRLGESVFVDGRALDKLARVTRGGAQPVGDAAAVERVLSGLSGEFWLYNLTALDDVVNDPALWREVEPV